jgi:hypothetical protein
VGKRILAVAVVVASACTALQYSMTEQHSVSVSNNPYMFNGGGTMMFTVTPKQSGDDDTLTNVYLTTSCSLAVDADAEPDGHATDAHLRLRVGLGQRHLVCCRRHRYLSA